MKENLQMNTQQGELILLLARVTKLVQPAARLEPNNFPPKLLGGDTGAELASCPFCSAGRGQFQIDRGTFPTQLACPGG